MSGNAKQRRVRRRRELRIRNAHFEEMIADLTESSQMAPFQRGTVTGPMSATEVAAERDGPFLSALLSEDGDLRTTAEAMDAWARSHPDTMVNTYTVNTKHGLMTVWDTARR